MYRPVYSCLCVCIFYVRHDDECQTMSLKISNLNSSLFFYTHTHWIIQNVILSTMKKNQLFLKSFHFFLPIFIEIKWNTISNKRKFYKLYVKTEFCTFFWWLNPSSNSHLYKLYFSIFFSLFKKKLYSPSFTLIGLVPCVYLLFIFFTDKDRLTNFLFEIFFVFRNSI